MTENNLYALNQVSKCNIAPKDLEISRTKITMYTKHFRQEINATVCRVKYQSEQWHCGFGGDSSTDAKNPVFIITALCSAHTLIAISSLFSSTRMVWTLPLEITPQSCSPYSLAITMAY